MNNGFKPKVTFFHCINSLGEADLSSLTGRDDLEAKIVSLPCSSMIKPVYLLKALEAGADGVVVLACPEGECRYVDGSVRAGKRIDRVRKMLDEIGLDGRRLCFYTVTSDDKTSGNRIVDKALADLAEIGPNPAVMVAG